MHLSSVITLAASSLLLFGVPVHADVFSSQGFTGDTTTLQALPGVDPSTGTSFSANNGTNNCVDKPAAYSFGNGHTSATRTECRVGNFSFSTTRSTDQNPSYDFDTTYGGNPPPWLQGWKPYGSQDRRAQ